MKNIKKHIKLFILISFYFAFGIQTVQAGSLLFLPRGSMLDGDAILDIETNVGDVITFEVFLNTIGNTGNVTGVIYEFDWDSKELFRLSFGQVIDVDGLFANSTIAPGIDGPRVEHIGGAILPGQSGVLLDQFSFQVLEGLVNDGVDDFSFPRAGVTGQGGRIGAFEFDQVVEVQPVPVPGTLYLLVIGLLGMFGLKKKVV